MAGLDDVKRNLAGWCAAAADRTAEAAKVTSKRYDKFAIGREIERRLADLGTFVYEGLEAGRTDLLEDPRAGELTGVIRDLMAEREAKEGEIDGIRREHAQRRRAAVADGGEDPGDPRSQSRAADPEFSD